MNEYQTKALIAAYKALCVINLDRRIQAYLRCNDPKAAEQVANALDALEGANKNLPVPEGRKDWGTRKASIDNLIAALNAYLDANDKALRGDALVYTQKEWRAKGEQYGKDAVATMIIDGSPLYDCFNYGTYGWGTLERFQEMLKSLGFYMELGYAWSVHFYPL